MLFYEGVKEDEIRRNCDALPNVEWMLLLTWGKWSPLSLEAFWQTPCGPLGVDRPLPLPVGWEGLLMVCVPLLLVLHLGPKQLLIVAFRRNERSYLFTPSSVLFEMAEHNWVQPLFARKENKLVISRNWNVYCLLLSSEGMDSSCKLPIWNLGLKHAYLLNAVAGIT